MAVSVIQDSFGGHNARGDKARLDDFVGHNAQCWAQYPVRYFVSKAFPSGEGEERKARMCRLLTGIGLHRCQGLLNAPCGFSHSKTVQAVRLITSGTMLGA